MMPAALAGPQNRSMPGSRPMPSMTSWADSSTFSAASKSRREVTLQRGSDRLSSDTSLKTLLTESFRRLQGQSLDLWRGRQEAPDIRSPLNRPDPAT